MILWEITQLCFIIVPTYLLYYRQRRLVDAIAVLYENQNEVPPGYLNAKKFTGKDEGARARLDVHHKNIKLLADKLNELWANTYNSGPTEEVEVEDGF